MNIPIYSQVKSRDGTLTRGEFMKNAFLEKNGEGVYNFRRPGLLQYGTNTAGVGQGITGYRDADDNEFLFQANGGTLYLSGILVPDTDFAPISAADSFTLSSQELVQANFLSFGGLLWLIGTNNTTGTSNRFGVFYSSDAGATWTELLDVVNGTAGYPDNGYYKATVFNDRIVLVGYTAFDVWVSYDGANWTEVNSALRSPTANMSCRRVVKHSDGNLYAFFATASGTAISNPVYKSADGGVTWATTGTSQAFESGSGRNNYGCVSFGGALWVIGGTISNSATAGREVYKSTDNGATFSEVGSDVYTSNAAAGAGAGGQSNTNITMIASGVMYTFNLAGPNPLKIYNSLDGITWTLSNTFIRVDSSDPGLAGLQSSGYQLDTAADGFGFHNGYFYLFDSPHGVSTDTRLFSLSATGIPQTSSLGSLGPGILDFAQNYARTRLVIKHSTRLFQLNTVTNTLAAVTDTDYPGTTCRGLVYLDGFFFVMDLDGNIYQSAEEDATSWDAVDFLAAQYEPDGGVALTKYNLYIVAFGEFTTEFFWNAGNASGSILLPVQQGVMNVGCADGDTVGHVDSQVIWVAQSKSQGQSVAKGRFVAQLSGNSYNKISTSDIDRILDADDFTDTDCTTFKVGGHSYYHLRLGSSNLSLVYDLAEQQWHIWTRRRDSFTSTFSSVVIVNGTATATVTSSWADGDVGVVTGFTGTDTVLNGTHNFEVASNVYKWGVSFSGTRTSTSTGTGTGWTEDDLGIVSAASYAGKQLLQDKSSGDLFEFDIDTYQDDSTYMDWSVRLPKIDSETMENKFSAWADLVCSRNSGNAMLRFSDDDCQTFTRYRQRSVSGKRTRWHRLGMYQRRNFEVRVTDNIPVRAEYLESN